MNNSNVTLVHLIDEFTKVWEFICINLKIVKACAPSRIDINCTDGDVSVFVSIDKIGDVLLILTVPIQPDPVIVRPFWIWSTLKIISWRNKVFGGNTFGQNISCHQ